MTREPSNNPVVSLTLEYDGTNYVGWQMQQNGPSIQAAVESALSELQGEPMKVVAAGRTDSGVHALGQVVSFSPPRLLPMKAYAQGMNGILPPDISVREARERPAGFDARRWSHGKLYRYRIRTTTTRAPLTTRYTWEIWQPLDVAAMKKAAPMFLGVHDFSAFRASNCEAKTTVRNVRRFEIIERDGELVIEVEATAFLRHMVRNMVGTLGEIGLRKMAATDVAEILESKDRTRAGRTAPPQGLCLVRVDYTDAPPESNQPNRL